ncbi:hypothetical protein [Iodobacter sp.]|uniref:hypothetical protein n=1 Tax=Iodobacter sp. TaxID=1915058 RepID=UPI0025D7124C|nr:hypothetical protein [Iodobacter sp.]
MSTPINGKKIQQEFISKLQKYAHLFFDTYVFIFVPRPGEKGASEAYISAKEKQKAFQLIGFKCLIFVPNSSEMLEFNYKKNNRIFFIMQRPLNTHSTILPDVIKWVNLDTLDSAEKKISAVSETAHKIIKPFLEKNTKNPPLLHKIGLVGSNGFFGAEISTLLNKYPVEILNLDIGSNLFQLSDVDIVISAVGKKNLILPKHLYTHKKLLIDVGFQYDESVNQGFGDFSQSCYEYSTFHTPVPGGIGPLQVLTLLERAALTFEIKTYKPWSALKADVSKNKNLNTNSEKTMII